METIGSGSKIDPITMLPILIPMFNPETPLLFSMLGGEFSRFALENPLECCCDIVMLCVFCILVNGDVVLIMLSRELCMDVCMWAAKPCCKFMFILAMLILPRFKLDAMLVGIMLTGFFNSGRRFKFVLLAAV